MMETVPSEGREKKSRLPRGPKPEWFSRDDAHEPNPGPKINRRENGPRIDGTTATATAKAKASMRSSGTPGSRGRLLSRPDPVAPVRQMLRESPPATGSAKEQAERDLIRAGPARGHWTTSQLWHCPSHSQSPGGFHLVLLPKRAALVTAVPDVDLSRGRLEPASAPATNTSPTTHTLAS